MMKKQPLVSVGIPTYNRPEGLCRTLECITKQTYKNLEIIISDNCSPNPKVKEVAKKFQKKDKRIQYFRQSKNIFVKNANFVLDKSTGEYFMWAADDDIWEPNYIADLLRVLRNNKSIVLVFPNFVTIDIHEKIVRKYPKLNKLSLQDNLFERLWKFICFEEAEGKANLVYGLIRSEAVKNIGGFPANIANIALDDLFLFSLLSEGKFYIFNKVLFYKTIYFDREKPAGFWKNVYDWHTYFSAYHRLINKNNLSLIQKITLHVITFFRELQFQTRFIKLFFKEFISSS